MHRPVHHMRVGVLAGIVVLTFALASLAGVAAGVSTQGRPSTTVTPDTAGSTATYEFSRFRTANRENVTGCAITFPPGTDASGAVAVDPAGTVTVVGRTVTIVFNVPVVPQRTSFDVVIGGIVNPAAGTYNAGSITMYWLNTQNGTTGTTALATGDYAITGSFLSMSITTPGPGQSVAFGAVDPGQTSAPQQVSVEVNSSADYQMTRTLGGDQTLLGLQVTGNASGSKTAGTQTFIDTYTLNPPWTTDPSVPLTATVTYTVVQ